MNLKFILVCLCIFEVLFVQAAKVFDSPKLLAVNIEPLDKGGYLLPEISLQPEDIPVEQDEFISH